VLLRTCPDVNLFLLLMLPTTHAILDAYANVGYLPDVERLIEPSRVSNGKGNVLLRLELQLLLDEDGASKARPSPLGRWAISLDCARHGTRWGESWPGCCPPTCALHPRTLGPAHRQNDLGRHYIMSCSRFSRASRALRAGEVASTSEGSTMTATFPLLAADRTIMEVLPASVASVRKMLNFNSWVLM